MTATKIATCCYCGTKAALVLRGKDRHELSCQTCGAPLHVMKMFPVTATPVAAPAAKKSALPRGKPTRPQKRRKGKSLRRKVFSELWDVIEDVFD